MLIQISNDFHTTAYSRKLGEGAEGTVYKLDSNTALKIFHSFDAKIVYKLDWSLKVHLYDGIRDISTAPIALAQDMKSQSKTIGYTMRLLVGYENGSNLANEFYCRQNCIGWQRIAACFHSLHQVVAKFHQKRIIIGDLRGSNFVFKCRPNQPVEIVIMDADSWQMDLAGTKLLCSAIHPSITHPDLIGQPNFRLLPYHDWFAFACEFARCLLQDDPFSIGVYKNWNSDQRREKGISCFHEEVILHGDDKLKVARLGNNLRPELASWLSGCRRNTFPISAIQNFFYDVCDCPDCGLEIHKSSLYCPNCHVQLK